MKSAVLHGKLTLDLDASCTEAARAVSDIVSAAREEIGGHVPLEVLLGLIQYGISSLPPGEIQGVDVGFIQRLSAQLSPGYDHHLPSPRDIFAIKLGDRQVCFEYLGYFKRFGVGVKLFEESFRHLPKSISASTKVSEFAIFTGSELWRDAKCVYVGSNVHESGEGDTIIEEVGMSDGFDLQNLLAEDVVSGRVRKMPSDEVSRMKNYFGPYFHKLGIPSLFVEFLHWKFQ